MKENITRWTCDICGVMHEAKDDDYPGRWGSIAVFTGIYIDFDNITDEGGMEISVKEEEAKCAVCVRCLSSIKDLIKKLGKKEAATDHTSGKRTEL